MKKYLSLALALAMITGTLSLVSCDSGKEPETTTTASTTTSTSNPPAANPTTPATTPASNPATTDDEQSGFDDGEVEDPIAIGWDAVLQAVGTSTNLMPDYFGTISEYTVATGYDWNPEENEGLGNETPPNLFSNPDNSADDAAAGDDLKWCCGRAEVEGCSAIIWSMTQSVTANYYAFKTANDNEKWPNRNPLSWRIYGTNEELTEDMQPTTDQLYNMEVPEGWELVDFVYEATLPDMNYTVCAFEIDNPTAYQHYMLCIDYIAYGGETFQLAEIFLFGSAD